MLKIDWAALYMRIGGHVLGDVVLENGLALFKRLWRRCSSGWAGMFKLSWAALVLRLRQQLDSGYSLPSDKIANRVRGMKLSVAKANDYDTMRKPLLSLLNT